MSVPTKWEINRAVRASDLPSPSRLIMLTLSDSAEAQTGAVPDDRAPSVSQLVAETGLGESAVKKHLALLESHGWIDRARPSAAEAARHVSSRYRLDIGTPVAGGYEVTPGSPKRISRTGAVKSTRGSRGNPRGGREVTPETEIRGPQGDPRNDTGGHEVTAAGGHEATPYAYIRSNNDQTQEPAANAAPAEAPESIKKSSKHETADELAAKFWEIHKSTTAQPFLAIRGVVRTAIANGIPRDDVARALDRLAKERRAISGGTITTALGQILGATNGYANGHTPWRNPSNPSDYYGDI